MRSDGQMTEFHTKRDRALAAPIGALTRHGVPSVFVNRVLFSTFRSERRMPDWFDLPAGTARRLFYMAARRNCWVSSVAMMARPSSDGIAMACRQSLQWRSSRKSASPRSK